MVFDNEKFVPIGNVSLPKSIWFNEEEKQKHLISDHKKIMEWEDYIDFMGDLSPLFRMTKGINSIEILEKYYKTYISIQIEGFSFNDNISLKNIYRLYHYISYGKFEHRTVASHRYCMLVRSEKKMFLLDGFYEIWQHFFYGEDLFEFFNQRIKNFYKDFIIRGRELDEILDDINSIGHYERVQLWSILEFLYSKENELRFNHNICQFWEYPNIAKIEKESGASVFSIGNLLLGTSYYNNKSGWIDFKKYPLMAFIYENRDNLTVEQINQRTLEIKNRLINFVS